MNIERNHVSIINMRKLVVQARNHIIMYSHIGPKLDEI